MYGRPATNSPRIVQVGEMKKERMTPAWERIWCFDGKSVDLGYDNDFVSKPEYFDLPPLGLIGWRYDGGSISPERARDIFKELGIEVPEELRKYLPPEEDEEDSNLKRNASSTTIHERRHSEHPQSRAGGEFLVMLSEPPYFMKDKSWYYYDVEEGILRLTDAAPPEARRSYVEHYEQLEKLTIRLE